MATSPPTPLLPTHRPAVARRWLILSTGAFTTTEAILFVAVTLMALTHGPSGAAIVLVAQALPRAVLLPWGGTLVDRYGPTRVLRVTAILRVVALLVLAAIATVVGTPSIVALAGIGALLGVVDGASYPAAYAAAPAVVDDDELARTNAVIGGVEGAGDLAGPVIAAALFAWTGAAGVLWIVVAVAVVSAIAADRLHRVAPVARVAEERPRFVDGLRAAYTDRPTWRMLVALAALSLLIIGPIMVGGALLAEQRLGGSDRLGWLLAAFGAGSILGLFTAPALSRRSMPFTLGIGGAALGGGMIVIGFASNLVLVLVIAAVMGAFGAALGIVLSTWLQQRTPEATRGRVMALVAFAMLALDPLSYALAGALLPLGATLSLVLPGIAVLGVALWAGFSRDATRPTAVRTVSPGG